MSTQTGKRKKSTAKKFMVAGAVAGTTYLVVGNALLEAFMARPDLKRHKKDHYSVAPSDAAKYRQDPESIPSPEDWFFAFAEKTELVSLRGETIYANIVRQDAPAHKWAVCCHGYTSRPSHYAQRGWELHKMGFHVLFPSLRGHGDSDSRLASMGWHDRLDVIDWITYILTLDPEAQILLYGVSMGAATVMMTTGETLPENVKCAVEDCGFTSVWDEFRVQFGKTAHLPAFPFLNAARTAGRLRLKYDFKEASALKAVRRSKIPTLFMHGDKDDFVPFWMLDVLYDNAVCPKEKVVIHGADHAASHEVDPQLYWSSVKRFVEKYITE
ncbi:MAG: alpha/beta hydrolase [Oscillospiraceae bacterium]|nr:alpha/beta hydrolase [Oscillospiraceae bacterium]